MVLDPLKREHHPGPGLAEAYAYHAYLRMLARDIGAAIVSLDRPVPPESWRWAGPWCRRACP